MKITNYGGRIVSLKVPDKSGAMGDVVLGFDSLEGYLSDNPYFGALIGRYANRIGHAQFTLDGVLYQVPKNDGDNSLHGGTRGFDKVVWTPRELPDGGLELTYLSKDGEQGYPGNCKVTVVYHLTDAERTEDRIRGDHRQGHGRQSDQSFVFQPGGQRRYSKSRADVECRPIHARR